MDFHWWSKWDSNDWILPEIPRKMSKLYETKDFQNIGQQAMKGSDH